ncbi:hypothetical protein SAMN04488071_2179 [Kordiimonas lacus]|uniref:Uncharacterized protein n=1 Tax=Kordiimonas lacus TaxID=637679 RepID=A0A1G7ACN8_9PROT|nr:hypothetical protein SAMN04488071_2179 [Kordiimonas lacus]
MAPRLHTNVLPIKAKNVITPTNTSKPCVGRAFVHDCFIAFSQAQLGAQYKKKCHMKSLWNLGGVTGVMENFDGRISGCIMCFERWIAPVDKQIQKKLGF